MATLAFDNQTFVKRLTQEGVFTQEQAEAASEALKQAFDNTGESNFKEFDDSQELKIQIDKNVLQLYDLLVISRTESMNLFFYFIGFIVLLGSLVILFASFLFRDLNSLSFLFREEILELSGSIFIFIAIGLIKTVQGINETWYRRNKIIFLIN